MRTTFFILISLVLHVSFSRAQPWKSGYLKASPDGHHLIHADGTPFFWLADTDWEMFHRLSFEEVEKLCKDRAKKHFNVLQAVALPELDGLRTPNVYGQLPFDSLDSSRPNEAYWKTVDKMIDIAAKHGLYVALLPTWGDKVTQNWGIGPVIFTPEYSIYAFNYGRWLSDRYLSKPNVLWMLGGDRPPYIDAERQYDKKWLLLDYRPVWRELARGILDANPKAFVTYHIWGGEHSTSQYLHAERWLLMNTIQSGHGGGHDVPIWEWITRDYQLSPTKPTLDAEPNYEDHPVNPWPEWDPANGYFNDYDVRKQLYRSVFAGACGASYGHHAIWQFWAEGREKINHADRYWKDALDRPGAKQAGLLRLLMQSRPMLRRIPDQSLILKGQGEKGEYMTALRASDGSYAMIYMPVGKSITVNTRNVKGQKLVAWWWNPKNGAAKKIGTFKKDLEFTFEAPALGIGNDWVLIIEDEAAKYKKPGK